jgi:hypothetical protein
MNEMNPIFILPRSVDLLNSETTNPLTYGTIDRVRDFLKLERKGIVEYVQ